MNSFVMCLMMTKRFRKAILEVDQLPSPQAVISQNNDNLLSSLKEVFLRILKTKSLSSFKPKKGSSRTSENSPESTSTSSSRSTSSTSRRRSSSIFSTSRKCST